MGAITESVLEMYAQQPAAAILMSGNGSNARAILEDPEIQSLYNITTIVTDNPGSNAGSIAEANGLELLERPVESFRDADHRMGYFGQLAEELLAREVEVTFYAGFMKVSSPDFAAALPGVNVHPADLSIKGEDGVAKYRGMQAMQQMRRELGYVRSTVHVIDNPVDSGSALAISTAVFPVPGQTTDEQLHRALQREEHALYTATLRSLGRGELELNNLPVKFPKGEKNGQ